MSEEFFATAGKVAIGGCVAYTSYKVVEAFYVKNKRNGGDKQSLSGG